MTAKLPLVTRNSPLRILMVANVPLDPNSGAAGTVYYTSVALKEMGHHVDEIWADQLGPRLIKHGNLHSLLEQPRRYLAAIRKAVTANEYDVIISQQPQSWMAALDHRRLKRKSIFLTMSQGVETRIWEVLSHFRKKHGVHAARFPHRLFTERLQRMLARQWALAVRYSNGIVVQHAQDQEYISKSYSIASDRVHISHSGLTPDFLNRPVAAMTPDRMQRMLFVGQNAFYKGVQCLGEIVTSLLRGFPQLSMTWVCNAADHEKAVCHFGADVRHRVKMIGWGSQQQLIDILDQHGIFVFPTLAEGFAKAPLEAMSRGLVVVASDCCGMRDYINDQVDGFLCASGDVSAFITRISDLLQLRIEPPPTSSICEKAMLFTWRDSARDLSEFMYQMIERKA